MGWRGGRGRPRRPGIWTAQLPSPPTASRGAHLRALAGCHARTYSSGLAAAPPRQLLPPGKGARGSSDRRRGFGPEGSRSVATAQRPGHRRKRATLNPTASSSTSSILAAVESDFIWMTAFSYFRKVVCVARRESASGGGADTISINKSIGACFINPGKHGLAVVPQLHKECRWLVKILWEAK